MQNKKGKQKPSRLICKYVYRSDWAFLSILQMYFSFVLVQTFFIIIIIKKIYFCVLNV